MRLHTHFLCCMFSHLLKTTLEYLDRLLTLLWVLLIREQWKEVQCGAPCLEGKGRQLLYCCARPDSELCWRCCVMEWPNGDLEPSWPHTRHPSAFPPKVEIIGVLSHAGFVSFVIIYTYTKFEHYIYIYIYSPQMPSHPTIWYCLSSYNYERIFSDLSFANL